MAGYRVVANTQVHHEGVTYAGGEALPAGLDPDTLAYWLNAGWIEEVPTRAAKRRSS